MTKPITPDEAKKQKVTVIPDFVISAFNDLILKNYSGNSAVVSEKEVVAKILSYGPNTTRKMIYDNHWLDVEDVFREAGWKVYYDKPGYCESYAATFTFTRK